MMFKHFFKKKEPKLRELQEIGAKSSENINENVSSYE